MSVTDIFAAALSEKINADPSISYEVGSRSKAVMAFGMTLRVDESGLVPKMDWGTIASNAAHALKKIRCGMLRCL